MRPVTPRRVVNHGKVRWRVIAPRAQTGGAQRARFFTSQRDAAAYAAELNGPKPASVVEFLGLEATAQDATMRALRALGGDAARLEVIAIEDARRATARASITIAAAVALCLEEKTAAGLRTRSLRSLKCSLHSLRDTIGPDVPVGDATVEAVGAWARNPDWGTATRRGRIIDARTFFAFALRQGWISSNPAESVAKPQVDARAPGILTPRQCAQLMVAARRVDPGLVPYLALCLFSGLRPENEARSTTWASVKGEHLEVAADRAKTRRRRLVLINPTLRAWLDLGGDLPVRNLAKRLRRVRERARIPWPHDCLRHSFVSYAVPVWGPAQVAQWSGHSEAVLFAHYRELVTRAEADRFWRLIPRKKSD